jgi:hypothetical protein
MWGCERKIHLTLFIEISFQKISRNKVNLPEGEINSLHLTHTIL